MRKTWAIAEYLRRQAWWRLNRVDSKDDGGNARSAIALLDVAAYVSLLNDDVPFIRALSDAGCFAQGDFRLPPHTERMVRFWHYAAPGGPPEALLGALATALRPTGIPAPRTVLRPLPR